MRPRRNILVNNTALFDIIEKLLMFVFDLSEVTDKLTKEVEELKKQNSILPMPPIIEKPPIPTPTIIKPTVALPPIPSIIKEVPIPNAPVTPIQKETKAPINLRAEMQKELKEAFKRINKQED